MTAKPHKSSKKRSRLPTFKRHWQGTLGDYVTTLAWSPQGDMLAVGAASGEVVVWSETALVSLLPAKPDSSINTLGFSADGGYLAAAGQQGAVLVWQTQSMNQPPVVVPNPHCWIDQLTWHPSYPWLAFGVGSQVQVWDAERSQPLAKLKFTASSILGLGWHPHQNLLAASGHTGVKVWQGNDWAAEPEFIEVPGASIEIAWSCDGRYLASGNLDHTLTVVSWENPPPWLMQGFPGKVRQVAWAAPVPDQPSLVAAACLEAITVWQRQGQGWQSRVLERHTATVDAIAFHPTACLLASASQDGQLCLWQNVKTLQQTLKGTESGFSAVAWHPQGTYLAAGGSHGEILIWKPATRGKGFQ